MNLIYSANFTKIYINILWSPKNTQKDLKKIADYCYKVWSAHNSAGVGLQTQKRLFFFEKGGLLSEK
ncbi:hypothetical protein BpHYR1_020420 [Brachionus plicatilis]|uniref:Uncharacterized protein n=1 Tax=Brachionus plicatilis TaxID=10195 RepID=A0A3M7PH89_BRAPC|nr:hypothetical protein BpHYR1_020420 [Brachionus plicatilis]